MTEATAPPTGSWLAALRRSAPVRLTAAGIHLALSLLVFAGGLYLILVHWYPGFHFAIDGGWRGVRIMTGVDLVLGPLLTLIIFNPLKARKLIVFDLTCIVVAQVAALAWAYYAIHGQRPVAISYHEGTFHSVQQAPLDVESYDVARLAGLSDRKPAVVYVAPPADENEATRATVQALVGTVLPHEDPFFFRRLADHWAEVRAQAVDPARRSSESAAFAQALPAFLAQHGAAPADFLYFPYAGRDGTCTLAFTPAGALVDAVGCSRY